MAIKNLRWSDGVDSWRFSLLDHPIFSIIVASTTDSLGLIQREFSIATFAACYPDVRCCR
jgi:hypothetical protein